MIAAKRPHLKQSPSSSKICLTAYFGNMAQKPNLYPQFKVKARTIKKKNWGNHSVFERFPGDCCFSAAMMNKQLSMRLVTRGRG